MLKISSKYVDSLNTALIILTCVAAHALPFHLLIVSYAVLGPAHYLTQISWLHDRRYFATSFLAAPLLAILTLILVINYFATNQQNLVFWAVILCLALGIALTFTVTGVIRKILAMIAGALLLWFVLHDPKAAIFLALLLPTVFHVFVFTAAFMLAGARKSGKPAAYVSFFTLLFCAGTFLIPSAPGVEPSLAGIAYFKPVADYLQNMFSLPASAVTQMFGFLSFAYTYHYLNWFSKAEVIHWNRISKRRLIIIVVIYIAALAVYFYNYVAGFLAILLLSLLHVVFEFPLNIQTFAGLFMKPPRALSK